MATGTLNACDYSYAPPNYGQAYAGGVRLFARYLSPSSGKDFTPTEIRTVHGLGAAALPLWEGYANDALQGYSKGRVDGLAAYGSLTALHQSTGYSPKNKPGVAFAVDFDAQPAQYPVLEQYFRGVREAVAGRIVVGVYGSADLVDHLIGVGVADFGFQTYAWSGGRVSPNAHLYQYENGQNFCGGQVDFCQINDISKLGAWFPPGSRNDNPGGNMSANGPEKWDAADWAAMYDHGASLPNFNKAAGNPKGKRQTLYTFLHNWISPLRAELNEVRADLAAIKSKMGA